MSETMFVKPAAGLKIRYPDRPYHVLPEEGDDVPMTSFWLRRLKEGSIISQRSAQKKLMNSWPET